ncbi:MAG: hypothetical protein ACRDJC_23300 [Thermomicrobiales bacterium]
MKHYPMGMRLVLIVLAALLALALPIAPSASPVGAKNRARIVTRTFRNAAPIEVPIAETSPVSASFYPSPIVVNGLKGTVRDVNVRLNDFSHDDPDEVRVLLVGPGGQTAIVLAEIGAEEEINDVTLRLDDEAAAPLSDATLRSGIFRPTNDLGSAIAFNVPAPPVTSANAALAVFDGTNPNGTWRLFVQDRNGPNDSGAFAGGWVLEITAKVKSKKKKR